MENQELEYKIEWLKALVLELKTEAYKTGKIESMIALHAAMESLVAALNEQKAA